MSAEEVHLAAGFSRIVENGHGQSGRSDYRKRMGRIELSGIDQGDASGGIGHVRNGVSALGSEWEVRCGDARDQIAKLPPESISCIVTSPPYFWLRDYNVHGQIGQEETVEAYVNELSEIFKAAYLALAPDGLFFLNIGDTFYSGKGKSHGVDGKSKKRRFGLRAVDKSGGLGLNLQRKSLIGIPWRVAMRLASDGWVLRSSIIWHRENCLPEHVRDRPSRSYEYVFMFAKSRFYYFDKQPLIAQDIEEDMWTIRAKPKARNGIDTAPFPDELVRRCLSIGCKPGGRVLDPFMGSGTTVRVASEMGLDAVGIELNSDFCDYAVRELER
jgi:DNA modification methylase